jgi:hypothetical protein
LCRCSTMAASSNFSGRMLFLLAASYLNNDVTPGKVREQPRRAFCMFA